jgi:hypothetical protein
MSDCYGRSPADVPAGLTRQEWERLRRFNATRLRQDLLEFAFGPEPIKAGVLAALWSLGCPLSLVIAVAVCSLMIYGGLCHHDAQRLAEAKRIAAKMQRSAVVTPGTEPGV